MKRYYSKLALLLLLLETASLFIFPSSIAHAYVYPVTEVANSNTMAFKFDDMIQISYETVQMAIKKGMMMAMEAEVIGQIGNGPNGPQFIADWRDALQIQPERASQAQLKNFFTTLGKGRNGNYVAADGSTSYAENILGVAEQSVLDMSLPQLLNLADYGVNHPARVLSQKNLRAFMTAYGSSGKIGNSAEAMLAAQDAKARYEEMNQRIAEAQAIANGGYYSKMAQGEVLTPGSSIRDLMASAQNMSFINLATSKTVQEAIGALIARTVANVASKGIRKVKSEVKDATGLNPIAVAQTAYDSYGAYNEGLKGSFGSLEAR